jgi:hypothetical protein
MGKATRVRTFKFSARDITGRYYRFKIFLRSDGGKVKAKLAGLVFF